LKQLTAAVQRMTDAQAAFEAVPIATHDEVGALCAGFNEMIAAIGARDKSITDLATHDLETNLPNRLAFQGNLARLLETTRERVVCVACFGVERFDQVRGAIGYERAADLIAELGVRLQTTLAGPALSRTATESLTFAFTAKSAEAAHVLIEQALALVVTPVLLGEHRVDIDARVGFVIAGQDGDTINRLMERASIALDQARAKRVRSHMFDAAAYGDPTRNLSLMSDMVRGMREGRLDMVLQPKWCIKQQRIASAEALVRWTCETRGPINPDQFVLMAEETGAIRDLTRFTLQRTIDHQITMRNAGVDIPIGVNLSGRLLGDAAFIEECIDLVLSQNACIEMEVTETAMMGDPQTSLAHMEALRTAGIELAIDDYGAGHSSLAYLKQIPASELKIDRSYVQALGQSQRDALLVKSTIDLALSLGLKVTAEGVETEAILAALGAMGCDVAQGWLIGKPVAVEDFIARFGARGQAASWSAANRA
jgi:predicted signal transduction protein with EAL and GGDEF domain